MPWIPNKDHSEPTVFCRAMTMTRVPERTPEKKRLIWGPSVRGLSPWLLGPMDSDREHHVGAAHVGAAGIMVERKKRQQEGVEV